MRTYFGKEKPERCPQCNGKKKTTIYGESNGKKHDLVVTCYICWGKGNIIRDSLGNISNTLS